MSLADKLRRIVRRASQSTHPTVAEQDGPLSGSSNVREHTTLILSIVKADNGYVVIAQEPHTFHNANKRAEPHMQVVTSGADLINTVTAMLVQSRMT